jgi:hypothetical protein
MLSLRIHISHPYTTIGLITGQYNFSLDFLGAKVDLYNALSNEVVINYELYGEKRGLGKFLYKFGRCCFK